MRTLFSLPLLAIIFSRCAKSSDTPTPSTPAPFDKSKLVNKTWLWGGKKTPQDISVNFISNDSAIFTQCVWYVVPYKYQTRRLAWRQVGRDSIYMTFKFRVYSLNDSVMITNNWVVGGPLVNPTDSIVFRTY
jgi:hypothetical protein